MSRGRHFHAGQTFTVDGFTFRVVEGRKEPDDLRLEWMTSTGHWLPMSMAVGFLMADFFYDNEEYLRTTRGREHWLGGQYYLNECALAAKHGWQRQLAKLEQKRAERQYRQEQLAEVRP